MECSAGHRLAAGRRAFNLAQLLGTRSAITKSADGFKPRGMQQAREVPRKRILVAMSQFTRIFRFYR